MRAIRTLFAVGSMIGVVGALVGCGGEPGEPAAAATAPLSAQQALSAAEAVYGDSATTKFGQEQAKLVERTDANGAVRSSWDVRFVSSEGEVRSVVDARSGEVVSTESVVTACNWLYRPYCGPGKFARCCGADVGWSCYVCY